MGDHQGARIGADAAARRRRDAVKNGIVPGQVAAELRESVDAALPRLRAITEEKSLFTRGTGKWNRRQILGHLIDSAVNNLHRFVRAQQGGELRFPDYDQPFWVDRNGYAERPWAALTDLWASLNIHLVHVIGRIPEDRLETPCVIGSGKPVTLGFIAADYGTHLGHHLDQILNPEGSEGKEPPPWSR